MGLSHCTTQAPELESISDLKMKQKNPNGWITSLAEEEV